ncbi:MAG: GDYXXLXY domain-containing protein [Acidovorax sp.]|uniref:GDYXXLXY domain-containing protein n=1 Tax=Acidovorax sp. TaxID=1872122 RepID=UPI0039E2A634
MTHPVEQAIAQGLLPPEARQSADAGRPWPVVLLTALGAWLAAIPLLAVCAFALDSFIVEGAGTYVFGVAVLAGAVALLRTERLPVFVEQCAMPLLLVGAGLLAWGCTRDLGEHAASAVLMAVALALGLAVPQAWLRTLLGAAAALLAVYQPMRLDVAVLVLTLAWLGLLAWHKLAASARAAAIGESLGTGWIAGTLVLTALASGPTFLLPSTDLVHEIMPHTRALPTLWPLRLVSLLCALAAFWLLHHAWPTLRDMRVIPVALVAEVLCIVQPLLGTTLLVLAVAATTRRWRIAALAACVAAWLAGNFYYLLAWPLATKAMLLAGAGAALGALAWTALRGGARQTNATHTPALRWAPVLAVLTAVATLAVVNVAIREKERTIAEGRKVFVALAPVDPRSLMQGDYMQLEFLDLRNLDAEVLHAAPPSGARPAVIARLDARGVATLVRVVPPDDATPLLQNELRIPLTPRDGRWMLVTDAWYFREGDGERWEAARFGEFRITPDGTALLVGMADKQLRPITP